MSSKPVVAPGLGSAVAASNGWTMTSQSGLTSNGRAGSMFTLSPVLRRGPIRNPVTDSTGTLYDSAKGLSASFARSRTDSVSPAPPDLGPRSRTTFRAGPTTARADVPRSVVAPPLSGQSPPSQPHHRLDARVVSSSAATSSEKKSSPATRSRSSVVVDTGRTPTESAITTMCAAACSMARWLSRRVCWRPLDGRLSPGERSGHAMLEGRG